MQKATMRETDPEYKEAKAEKMWLIMVLTLSQKQIYSISWPNAFDKKYILQGFSSSKNYLEKRKKFQSFWASLLHLNTFCNKLTQ